MSDPAHKELFSAGTVKRIYYGVWIVCIALGLLDVAHAYHKHPHFSWEKLPNFYGFYGFVSFVFLVLVAKSVRPILKRREDYYD